MISIFLHLLLLAYGTVHFRGELAIMPATALVIWTGATIIILVRTLPDYVSAQLEDYRFPSFTRFQNIWQWSLVLWIITLHIVSDPVANLAPKLVKNLPQLLPMALSTFLYIILAWPVLFEVYRLFKPILDERQTVKDFFRARMTVPILFFPPILLWMLIEDLAAFNRGIEELQDLRLLVAAPVFFIFLYLLAPRLFNWAWRAEPVHDAELENEITQLSLKADTPITGVKIWNTFNEPVPNAAVAGLSKKYRFVYITRYLLKIFNKNQIRGVIAHELAHLRLGHVFNYMLYSLNLVFLSISLKVMVIIFFPSWITGSAIQDAIEMSLFLVVFAITFTALARNSEYQADAFAAEMAGKENFASGLETLQQNIMPTSGKIPAWLLTHPEIPDRINRVRYWQGTINDLLKKSRRTRQMLIALAVLLMIATIPALGPVMQLSRLANAARAGDLTQGRRALDSLPGWLLSHPLTVRESGKLAMKTGRWDIAFFQGVKAHWNLNSVVRSEELHHSAAPEVAFYFKFMQFMLQTLDLG